MNTHNENRIRYELLDELRGFAVVCMVFYHGFYAVADMYSNKIAENLLDFFMPAEPFFAAGFLIISGFCTVYSRKPLKRGIMLAAVAALITAATASLRLFGIDEIIIFGIIHLLALCWLLYAVLKKPLKKINPVAGLIFCAVVFFVTYHVESGYLGFGSLSLCLPESLYSNNYLCFLGFTAPGFYSADFFEVFPWLFAFFAGSFLARICNNGVLPEFFRKKRLGLFGVAGRNALWVYIFHQPVILGAAWLVSLII